MTTSPFIPKIIFFDIDDTLSRNGILAENNYALLEQLTKTDIILAIATGRSKGSLPPDILNLFELGLFDVIVCTNGQFNFTKNHTVDEHRIISHYPLSLEQAKTINSICEDRQLIHKFDSAVHMAWANETKVTLEICDQYLHAIIDPDYFKSNEVYQCSVLFDSGIDFGKQLDGNRMHHEQENNDEYKMQDVDFASHGFKLVCWHHIGGDILPIEASKARGIKDVCVHYNIDVSEAMAFGDGFNDIEMFDIVGYSVAMGDAQPALQERADFVTGTMEEDGIAAVLAHLFE